MRAPDGKWLPGESANPETQWKPGSTPNPAHMRKTRRELVTLARESIPRAFERARQLLDDDNAEWRAWIEAGKFLAAYGMGPPKPGAGEEIGSTKSPLTVEEQRAIARMRLSTETAALPESAAKALPDGTTEH